VTRTPPAGVAERRLLADAHSLLWANVTSPAGDIGIGDRHFRRAPDLVRQPQGTAQREHPGTHRRRASFEPRIPQPSRGSRPDRHHDVRPSSALHRLDALARPHRTHRRLSTAQEVAMPLIRPRRGVTRTTSPGPDPVRLSTQEVQPHVALSRLTWRTSASTLAAGIGGTHVLPAF
jgi:hypothetical protein